MSNCINKITTDSYINYLLDISTHTVTITKENKYKITYELPNGYIVTVESNSMDRGLRRIKKKVKELECYLELDKIAYNYEFENEYR